MSIQVDIVVIRNKEVDLPANLNAFVMLQRSVVPTSETSALTSFLAALQWIVPPQHVLRHAKAIKMLATWRLAMTMPHTQQLTSGHWCEHVVRS